MAEAPRSESPMGPDDRTSYGGCVDTRIVVPTAPCPPCLAMDVPSNTAAAAASAAEAVEHSDPAVLCESGAERRHPHIPFEDGRARAVCGSGLSALRLAWMAVNEDATHSESPKDAGDRTSYEGSVETCLVIFTSPSTMM